MQHVDVVIAGGGPAGISAAIWCKRLGINHLLLEKKGELGGQLTKIQNEIIDYPGLQVKNGKEMQQILIKQVHELQCSSKLNVEILSINSEQKTIQFKHDNEQSQIKFRYLILATGAGQKWLVVPGEKEMIERGELYSATADGHLFKNKTVAVVGGGDRAVEGAILLSKFAAKVYIIHRSQSFKARNQYLDIALEKENITILPDTQVIEIHGEKQVKSLALKNIKGETNTLMVDAVLVRIGTKPNSELLKGSIDIDNQGLIVTDQIGRTSKHFIYAIGDVCTNPLFTSISSSVGQGALVAKHISSLSLNTT